MNFYQLEVFCTVANAKSISKAARKLHLSQPAVSQQIQAMESYYNVTLFNRSPQGVTLTEPGELVYEYAQKLIALFNELENNLDKLMGIEDHNIYIGASNTIGNYSIPCSLWAFKQKNPLINIKLDIKNSAEIVNGVISKNYDLGLVEGDLAVDANKVVTKKIHEYPLVIITPNQEPWSKMSSITLEQLSKTPLIIREENSGTRRTLLRALKEKGIDYSDLNIMTEMTAISAIKSSVQAGLGISICADIAAQKEVTQGTLLALPIEDVQINLPFYMVYLPEKFLSSVAKKFIRFIAMPDQRGFC